MLNNGEYFNPSHWVSTQPWNEPFHLGTDVTAIVNIRFECSVDTRAYASVNVFPFFYVFLNSEVSFKFTTL